MYAGQAKLCYVLSSIDIDLWIEIVTVTAYSLLTTTSELCSRHTFSSFLFLQFGISLYTHTLYQQSISVLRTVGFLNFMSLQQLFYVNAFHLRWKQTRAVHDMTWDRKQSREEEKTSNEIKSCAYVIPVESSTLQRTNYITFFFFMNLFVGHISLSQYSARNQLIQFNSNHQIHT